MRRSPLITAILLLSLLCILGLTALSQGTINIPITHSIRVILEHTLGITTNNSSPLEHTILLDLRLPRTLLAIFVGALLAQSGAVMQGVFRNPLADPGIIGVSSGAGIGAVVAIGFLPAAWLAWSPSVLAFVGAMVTTGIVYQLARSAFGTSTLVLLLAGVAIAAFSGAAIGFLTYMIDNQSLRQFSLWQMGTLVGADMHKVGISAGVLLIVTGVLYRHARALNALALGEAEARHLGVHVERLKIELILLVAVGVGVAVAAAGIIGFVGLVVPHMIRLVTTPDHRSLLPLSALLGAVVLLAADVVARLVMMPAELPVGIVTTLIGAPFLLILLMRYKKRIVVA
jgi:iron complex transport system permease protein